MYKVINGRQICTRYKPEFIRGGLTEQDFLEFLKKSQDYFMTGNFEEKYTKIFGKSAYGIWVDIGCAVWAEPISFGRYRVTINGNHRAYVARKYNLKILIYIEDDAISGKQALF